VQNVGRTREHPSLQAPARSFFERASRTGRWAQGGKTVISATQLLICSSGIILGANDRISCSKLLACTKKEIRLPTPFISELDIPQSTVQQGNTSEIEQPGFNSFFPSYMQEGENEENDMKTGLETNPQARCAPLALVVTVCKSRSPTVSFFIYGLSSLQLQKFRRLRRTFFLRSA